MNNKSELDCYLFYMWNEWRYAECVAIFGLRLGEHFWGKWCYYVKKYRTVGAVAPFYTALDADNRHKIVERAMAHYNK